MSSLDNFEMEDLERARKEVFRLCKRDAWGMSIPPQRNDSDMLFLRILNRVEFLEKENKKLKKAIVYSRQFYYLPQMVLDVFYALVPGKEYDDETDKSFYQEIVNGESK